MLTKEKFQYQFELLNIESQLCFLPLTMDMQAVSHELIIETPFDVVFDADSEYAGLSIKWDFLTRKIIDKVED